MSTTYLIKLINKNEFTKIIFNKNIKISIVYINNLALKIIIYPIKKAETILLIIEKVIILTKNLDFASIFLKKSVELLPKYIKVNKYVIKLEKRK